jgi:SAM-dependent methyltransferase
LIIFSHVLEHLRNPSRVLQDAKRVLAPGGYVAVALPNVLTWRVRLQFLAGRFDYQDGGIMDDTHLRFYTFETGKRLLETNGFHVSEAIADGSFPCRYLRRLMPGAARYVDRCACALWPGLFGWQLLYIGTPK